jgi:hypothetical protein
MDCGFFSTQKHPTVEIFTYWMDNQGGSKHLCRNTWRIQLENHGFVRLQAQLPYQILTLQDHSVVMILSDLLIHFEIGVLLIRRINIPSLNW